ncbi:unnamed protein product [Acanthoscelides obtectus]|uniref:Uncharacterized protein n=1 Tax=Acanthoscelides obtectus TaxID=200917 RepID=A0A9P0L3N8_ACAOB|nr:unnamed protein product [Acanthoscelides obtectus]CAK1680809.1 hypothetical protein AOBTE_LOCUS32889 [Acanthoscelides obtectus]
MSSSQKVIDTVSDEFVRRIEVIVQYILLIDELILRTAAIAVPPTTETDVIQDRCCGLNTEEAIFTDSQLDVPVIENIMNCSPSPTTMSTDNDPEPFIPSDSSYTPSNQASESDSEPDEVTYQPSKKQRKRKPTLNSGKGLL